MSLYDASVALRVAVIAGSTLTLWTVLALGELERRRAVREAGKDRAEA